MGQMTMDHTRSQTRPRKLGARLKHFWLAQRMAKRTGVDLSTAYETGDLTQNEWSKLVTRCRGCDWAEGCQRFLNAGGAELRPIPVTCENSDTLQRLKYIQRN